MRGSSRRALRTRLHSRLRYRVLERIRRVFCSERLAERQDRTGRNYAPWISILSSVFIRGGHRTWSDRGCEILFCTSYCGGFTCWWCGAFRSPRESCPVFFLEDSPVPVLSVVVSVLGVDRLVCGMGMSEHVVANLHAVTNTVPSAKIAALFQKLVF